WDAVSGKELARSQVIDIRGESVLLPDGRLALCTYKEVKILEVFTARELVRFTLDSAGQGLAFSPDGSFLASTEDGGAVRVWDVASGKLLQVHRERSKSISRPAFSPD